MSFLPALSRLERQALLVGLSDARNNRRISKPGRQSRLQLLARLIFGTEGFATLADPHLEALRDLAMRHGGPPSCSQGDAPRSASLDPLLVISAPHFLTACLPPRWRPHAHATSHPRIFLLHAFHHPTTGTPPP